MAQQRPITCLIFGEIGSRATASSNKIGVMPRNVSRCGKLAPHHLQQVDPSPPDFADSPFAFAAESMPFISPSFVQPAIAPEYCPWPPHLPKSFNCTFYASTQSASARYHIIFTTYAGTYNLRRQDESLLSWPGRPKHIYTGLGLLILFRFSQQRLYVATHRNLKHRP